MDELNKDYQTQQNNLDTTTKHDYLTNQNLHTTISHSNHLLTNESTIFHPLHNSVSSKKINSDINTTNSIPLTSATLASSAIESQITTSSTIVPTSTDLAQLQTLVHPLTPLSTLATTTSISDSQRTIEANWYHHPHQLDESNFFNKLHDCPDSYLNSRYNVKGIRNERTSSFFDIPAATHHHHHPYCYRFPSTTSSLLKKELGEERPTYSNHSIPINQHFHSIPHHHQIEHPDSTTNLNPHHQNQLHHHQTLTQPSPTSSPSEVPSYSYNQNVNNTNYGMRSDSSIVSSTEPEIGYNGLYTTGYGPISGNSVNQRRGSLQLWQFLVTLLDEPSTSAGCIAWTGRGMEFKLIEPEEVARRWGIQKNRPAMNYDKLSRSLRYYYEKGIMQKVAGERYVYKFVCDPDALFNMAYGHLNSNDPNYSTS